MKMITQPPARIEWEEAVLRLIEDYGVTRSDAQAIIEAKEEVLDSLYQAGTEPALAARRFMD
jgi:hypothetical protein